VTEVSRLGERYVITPLDARHDRGAFSCGVEALDRYLRERASQDARRRVTSIFVAEDRETGAVQGFYTLAMAALNLDRLPPELARKMPRYPTVPAVRLGRLAVHAHARGQGLGAHLLFDALARSLRNEIAWAAFLVDAKDEAARRFYLRFDLTPLVDDGLHLYALRGTLERLFPPGAGATGG
jgi:GNAT superfamily N-acetyltransferase